MAHFPLLSVLIVLPAVGAVVTALVPRNRPELARVVGVSFAMATTALCGYLLTQFKVGDGGFQLVDHHVWISEFGISWKVGVDGISLFLVALTGLLFPIAMIGPIVHRD